MADSDPLLQVEVQRLRLGETEVLREVRFSCAEGSHTAILGPNGAGKTTLLRAMAGLVHFEGSVTLAAEDVTSLHPSDRARRITYVPQRSLLQSSLSVDDVVMQGRYAHQNAAGRVTSADRKAVLRAMEMTDTERFAHRRYPQLSGGEQRRVLLARALATEADVILLDEPTAALDIAHQLSFFAVLQQLANTGRTIVTVLHDLRDAERWCHEAVVLDAGKLEFHGSAQLPQDLVQQVYGVRALPNSATTYELAEGES